VSEEEVRARMQRKTARDKQDNRTSITMHIQDEREREPSRARECLALFLRVCVCVFVPAVAGRQGGGAVKEDFGLTDRPVVHNRQNT
jgi:hypothetical protein